MQYRYAQTPGGIYFLPLQLSGDVKSYVIWDWGLQYRIRPNLTHTAILHHAYPPKGWLAVRDCESWVAWLATL